MSDTPDVAGETADAADSVVGGLYHARRLAGELVEVLDRSLGQNARVARGAQALRDRPRGGPAAPCIMLLLVLVGPGPANETRGEPPVPVLQRARDAHAAGDFSAAERLYAEAHAAGAGREYALTRRAECLMRLGRDADTLALCESLTDEKSPLFLPNCGRAHYLRGRTLERLGRPREAELAVQEAARCGDAAALKFLSLRR